ncbi:hypothetical protein [Kitasatospora sp. NPDC059827]|uniref:hypothetical protein n=1 Tax=Kitasatospora sp. NPDC059827 TaxID=3346964 RepID=UPI00364AF016
MHARFIGLDPWSPPLHTIELLAGSRYLDLHNDTALLGFRLGGHPKLTLTGRRHGRNPAAPSQLKDVMEFIASALLAIGRALVALLGWVATIDGIRGFVEDVKKQK